MRIIALSDFHGSSVAVDKAAQAIISEDADLTLVTGDLAFHSMDSAFSILQRLSASESPMFFVPGNMDTTELIDFKQSGSARCIHGRCETFGDFSFIGVGGAVRGPFMTPFETTEKEIQETLQKAVKDCRDQKLVLISHVPPKNTLVDLTRSGMHAGSEAVRSFIELMQPFLTVCGHIHEARGTDKIGKTLVVNPGPAQNWFYSVIDLTDTISVKLLEFV